MTALDPETGEVVGPASAVQALLDEADFRVWTEGLAPAATAHGDALTCKLVTDRPGGEQALLPMATTQLPVALAVWLGLGPRPVPEEPAIRLEPGAMAVVIGRREVHGHGLEHDVATALQRRLDRGVRHWAVCVECAAWRRNLEVVDGEAGIWRVRPVDALVELAPTSTTAVVRELIQLIVTATESGPTRGPMIADRPASPSD